MLRPKTKTLFYAMLLVMLLFPLKGIAQSVIFFSSKQGLSNSCIRNIYEDSRHNIWITTKNGLNRYDGVKMNVYRHDENDSTSLNHDESTCVLDYDHDNVLIGTGAGMQMYSHVTGKFSKVTIKPSEGNYTITPRIVRFAKLRSGKIMVCMAGFGCGEVCTDKNGEVYVQTTDDYNIGEHYEPPIQFFEDKENRLWAITSNFRLYRKEKNGKFKLYNEFTDVVNVCKSVSGRMYVATVNNGLYCYDNSKDCFNLVATSAECGTIANISRWAGDDLIICSDGGGLRIYNEKTDKVKQSALQINDFNLATSNVKDAIIDSFGNVWVAIYWKGVMMKPINQSAFEYVGRHSITKNTLGTNSVLCMAPTTNNQILVGTDNSGLYILSPDGTSSTHINPDEHPGMPRTITAIMPQSDGSALLGSFFDGLYLYKNGNVTLLNRDIHFIFDIKPSDNGSCWIASMGNYIYKYNPSTNATVCYDNEQFKELEIHRYSHCIIQKGNKIIIGSNGGIKIGSLNAEGGIATCKDILRDLVVRQMVVLGSDIWAATDKGLYCIDINTYNEKHYTTTDGLPINSLKSITASNGNLWVGSDHGLVCFDPKTKKCETFFDADGLQDNEFESRAVLNAGNTLYFGGVGGLTYFIPSKLEKKGIDVKLPLRIVDLFISSEAIHVGDISGSHQILTENIDDASEINLNYTDNHFTLQLTIDGIHNQHIVYEYSINGSDWITEEQSNGRLMFSNLKSGSYKIKIRARGFGMMSDERELKVIVHAPWYASAWAKFIYLLLFIALCWLAYEYIRRQVQARKVIMRHRQEKQINEARIQFFMNISHEIRTPMTLILAPLEKLLNNDKDPERQRNYKLMKQNSNRILRLINQMMDVRKIEQGKFHLDYHQVELVGLLQNIYDVFTTNAQNRKIEYKFEHNVNSLVAFVDPENIDKIVMNLLSNAFKFTPDGGKITLSLAQDESGKGFTISTLDNGCGISEKDKEKIFDRFYSASHQNGYIGTGIGLNLTYLLVQLHRGNISVADGPEGKGTLFIVDIPVGDKSLVTYTPSANTTDEAEEAPVATIGHEDIALADEETEKPSDTHNKHILLVEDDENIRQYVKNELSGSFVINECTNGQEAWDFVISHPQKVNLIISDIMMPVMDGMTLCQKVKQNFTTNHIPVILMTALGSDADRIAGISNGADAYISKPFNIDVLQSTALNLMKTRRMLAGKFNGEKQQKEKIEKVEVESPDEHLMRRVMKCINANMSNQDLSVEMIADQVGISRVHFYRKMKELTGQSPRDYLKYVRLKEAERLIREKPDLDITSVSMAVGFKSLSAFSTNFKALFGKSPSEWNNAE